MPILLHMTLMFGALIVGFFAVGVYSFTHVDELTAAGAPVWMIRAAPLVWCVGVVVVFHFVPVRCRGCRWSVSFLCPSRKMIYRCLNCGHVHCTIWGGGFDREAPKVTRLRLSKYLLSGFTKHRVTISGHVWRPCTLALCLQPAPLRNRASELEGRITARAIDEQGRTLACAAGQLSDWQSERWFRPFQTELVLRHATWRDIALRADRNIAIEIEAEISQEPRHLQPMLEFREGNS